MMRIDVELIGAVYALYAYDCIHWLKEEDVGFTRGWSRDWRIWRHGLTSFTLLGRRPCVVNLLPFFAGFACVREEELPDAEAMEILQELDRRLGGGSTALAVATSAEAAVMLLLVPAMFLTNAVHYAWQPLLALIVMTHAATAVLFVRGVRRWERSRHDRVMDLAAILANPLSAIRSGDVLVQRAFDALRKERSVAESGRVTSRAICPPMRLDA
jgi:hypothetical protein